MMRGNHNIPALIWMTLTLFITACGSVEVQEGPSHAPKLDPRTFFDGKICADGVVRDRSGKQTRHFNARILASWNEQGVGTLDEVFDFNDGRETRQWQLKPATNESGGTYYIASANDVVGETEMHFAGNTIHMQYVLRYVRSLDEEGEPNTVDLDMDDWMYQVAEGVVVNETRLSKWGLHLGQVLLVMRKVSDGARCLPNVGS